MYLQAVQEKLLFHNSLQPLPRLHRCKRPSKLSLDAMRVYIHSYWPVIFCTTNSSRVLARERLQTFENSWKKMQYLMNTLYVRSALREGLSRKSEGRGWLLICSRIYKGCIAGQPLAGLQDAHEWTQQVRGVQFSFARSAVSVSCLDQLSRSGNHFRTPCCIWSWIE